MDHYSAHDRNPYQPTAVEDTSGFCAERIAFSGKNAPTMETDVSGPSPPKKLCLQVEFKDKHICELVMLNIGVYNCVYIYIYI